MEKVFHAVDRLSEITGKVGSILVVIMSLAICYDVILRYIFAWPCIWSYDMTIMLYGGFAVLGMAYCHYRHQHVRMDLLYGLLSTRGKAIIDIIGYVFLFFPLMTIMLYKCGENAIWSIQIGERSASSVWRAYMGPFKLVISYGLALFLLQGIVDFVRCVMIAIKGVGHES